MTTKASKPSTNNLNTTTTPSWQILHLIAHNLDPKTLARASCVSKTWSSCFSSDHHWKSLCTTQYPSLSTLKTTHPHVPYRRIYTLSHAAEKRLLQNPLKPHLSLQSLVFSITIGTVNGGSAAAIVVPGEDLGCNPNGLFQFDIKTRPELGNLISDKTDGAMKICWNVVLKNWGGVFCMMECEGKGEGWFLAELPSTGCCPKDTASGLEADLKIGFCEENGGMMRAEKVSVGLLSVGSWRYVSVEDGLRYLQHFLVPSKFRK